MFIDAQKLLQISIDYSRFALIFITFKFINERIVRMAYLIHSLFRTSLI